MRRWTRQIIVSVTVAFGLSGVAYATLGDPSSSSTSYKVIEGEVGGDGQFNAFSSNYGIIPTIDGGTSLGESAVGNSSSGNYQTNAGTNTSAAPTLSLIVNNASVNLGILSTIVAKTATATFSVSNYTSNGYVVQIVGSAPKMGGHTLTNLGTDTASAAGTEQFGINLRANTSPVILGNDPSQNPSSTFSYGVAGDGITGTYGSTRPYTQPNKYRFNSGEVVASAPKSSGVTDYTLSFLANQSPTTPSGVYSGNLSVVVTGSF